MNKKTILLLSRGRLDTMLTEAIEYLKKEFEIVVLCTADNVEKYEAIDGIAVEFYLTKQDVENIVLDQDMIERANAIEEELGLNAYASNVNYLLYKKYAKKYYRPAKTSYWHNAYTVQLFVKQYELMTSIIKKYHVSYAFFETIDFIETNILDALDKKGLIKTYYFHRNPLGNQLRMNLATGANKHNPKLDIIYEKNMISEEGYRFAEELYNEANKSILENTYDAFYKKSLFKKHHPLALFKKINFNNLKFLFRRKQARKYFSDKLPSKYVAYFMQHTPEASVFVPATTWNNQQNLIELLAISAKAGYGVVVKEHPKTFGRRPLEFYKELSLFPNVTLVAPEADGKRIAKNAVATLTLTGSLGFDSLLYGTKVFALVDSYLTVCGAVKRIFHPKELWDHIEEDFYSKEEVLKLIAARYDSSYPFPMGKYSVFPESGSGEIFATALIDNIRYYETVANR